MDKKPAAGTPRPVFVCPPLAGRQARTRKQADVVHSNAIVVAVRNKGLKISAGTIRLRNGIGWLNEWFAHQPLEREWTRMIVKPVRLQQNGDGGGGTPGRGTSVITRTKPKTKKPNLYRVLIINDDYTPMEFVIHILERFFQKDREAATRIMLHVHNHGVGECGVFTYEVAETKVTQVMDFAREHQHPLQCVMEKK